MPRPLELPEDANTWGYDAFRLVYLVKFDIPYPADGVCPRCRSSVIKKDWDAHMPIHREWLYVHSRAPYLDGLSQHRDCHCGIKYKTLPLFCWECGGYISLEYTANPAWLTARRITKTEDGNLLVF